MCLLMVVVDDRMNRVPGFLDLRLETRVLVCSVVYGSRGTVCFKQLVVAFNFVTVTFLSLFLDVLGVWVIHFIFELVFWVGLQNGIRKSYILFIFSFCNKHIKCSLSP